MCKIYIISMMVSIFIVSILDFLQIMEVIECMVIWFSYEGAAILCIGWSQCFQDTTPPAVPIIIQVN